MKNHLATLVQQSPSTMMGRNLAREYLQARILASLQRAGAMIPLAFHGGTALRFLYNIPRYSEDLDFALERSRDYNLRQYLQTIHSDFTAEGYEIDVKLNEHKVVHSAFVRFPGLLHELKLSPHRPEVFAVKIEVDTNPPAGAELATTLVRRHVILHLQHHDQASLLAGKLHAILTRPYTKGRDIYDLLWYLTDPSWPPPNLLLLGNALRQTGWDSDLPTEHTWRHLLRQRIAALNWDQVIADVRPFLQPDETTAFLTLENLDRLLE